MSKYIPDKEFSVTISGTSEIIPNIYELEKIGAGHDGYIYRFHDYALKILKYDIKLRKKRGLMTFEKATYFRNHLNLQRITQPIDVLLDEDGVYTGYVMRYVDDLTSVKKKGTPQYRNPGDYSCGDLVYSWEVLADDFNNYLIMESVLKILIVEVIYLLLILCIYVILISILFIVHQRK